MSKKTLLKKLLCALLCTSLASKGLVAQKSYGNLKAETEVRNYFSAHATQYGLNASDLNSLKITGDYVDATIGIRHIYVQQQLNGLDVVNATAALHLKQDGTPAHAVYQFAKLNGVTGSFSALTPATAVQKAMADVNIAAPASLQLKENTSGIDEKTVFRAAHTTWDIPVRKAYLLNDKTSTVTPVWEVQLYIKEKQNYWIMYLDGTTGKVIYKQDMVVKCDFGRPGLITDEFPNNGVQPAKTPTITLTPKTPQNPENVYRAGIAPNTPIRLEDDMPINNANNGVVNGYRVFDLPYEAPNQAGASHTIVNTGGDGLASPDGWHKVVSATPALSVAYPVTYGNNVFAYYDPAPTPLAGLPPVNPLYTAFNNGGIAGAPAAAEPFLFDYPLDFTASPGTSNNQKAAIVNLFYWNNLMHDVFYHFGFTEDAKNFQQSHVFSTGLRGAATSLPLDAVLAQAQDGGGTNNANFLTLADGVNGQMQMYLWTASLPDSIVSINTTTAAPPAAGKKYYSIQGSFGNSVTSTVLSTDLYTNPVLNKPFVIVQKNALSTVGTSSEGCGTNQMSVALPPANDVSGKIVIIDRGTCSFVEKVLGAQLGGAAGVIVVNNVPGAAPIAMGGTDAPTNLITIPAVMVTYEAGKEIETALANGATIVGSLKKTVAAPNRDGDLDNGVMSHEYGHGISTRLTAGGPNPTGQLGGAEQGGEGWSDNFALYMTTKNTDLLPSTTEHPNGVLPNRGIGSYVVFQPHATGLGIREYRYSIDLNENPSTFAYAKLPAYTEAHSIGFLWCSMLYEVNQAMIDIYGFNNDVYNPADPTASHNVPTGAGGNNVAMRLVMEGLKLQPASPTFVQERDAILKADTLLYNGQHACVLWKAFAKRGLGYSAVSGTNALGDEVEAFNVSPLCNPQTNIRIVKTGPAIMTNKEEISYSLVATNVGPAALAANNVIVTDTLPSYATYVSSDGGTLNGNIVSWPATNLTLNTSVTHTVKVKVAHPTPATLVLNENNEGATDQFAPAVGVRTFSLVTTGAYSGSKAWYVQDYDVGGVNARLEQSNPVAIPAGGAYLIFYHKYATESTYDGGIVEVSTDGTTWTYLNTFTKNGYNGTITSANNPYIGLTDRAAFSGSSGDYVQSIADLGAYAGQNVYVRFRFVSDIGGGAVAGGGWWIDDILIATQASFVTNKAAANATNASAPVNSQASTLIINSPCLSTIDLPIPLPAGTYTADGLCIDTFANWMHFYEGSNLLLSVKKTDQTATLTPAKVKVGITNGTAAVQISAPYAVSDYPGKRWFVMRRYWNVDTTLTFNTATLPVRFYYTNGEYQELQTAATDVTSDDNAKVYKFLTSTDPNPATGHAGVTPGQVSYPGYKYLGTNSNYKYMEFEVTRFSGGGIGGTAALVLPIEGIKELKATVRNKTIALSWETIFENNNRGFEILRKAPTDADFVSIGFVNGAGNSNATIPYSFTDAAVTKGILYQYKLKQVSTSGRLQYSNTVTGRIIDGLFAFSFSPNPARNSVTFNVNNENRTPVYIDITDVTGKKIKSINAGSESYINLKMSLESFAKGVYLVSINSGNYHETQKLVVD